MPANMMNAPVGSRLYVRGRSRATVIAGPMPGSTPTAVPTKTPISARNRYCGCSAVPKPSMRAKKLSTEERHPLQQWARGQRDAQPTSERRLQDQRHQQAYHDRPPPLLGAQHDRRSGEQRGRGDGPTGRDDQEHVDEEEGDEHPDDAPVGVLVVGDVLAVLSLAPVAAQDGGH